jgi:hypothetical protein
MSGRWGNVRCVDDTARRYQCNESRKLSLMSELPVKSGTLSLTCEATTHHEALGGLTCRYGRNLDDGCRDEKTENLYGSGPASGIPSLRSRGRTGVRTTAAGPVC